MSPNSTQADSKKSGTKEIYYLPVTTCHTHRDDRVEQNCRCRHDPNPHSFSQFMSLDGHVDRAHAHYQAEKHVKEIRPLAKYSQHQEDNRHHGGTDRGPSSWIQSSPFEASQAPK
jgi:hypothetical protein